MTIKGREEPVWFLAVWGAIWTVSSIGMAAQGKDWLFMFCLSTVMIVVNAAWFWIKS